MCGVVAHSIYCAYTYIEGVPDLMANKHRYKVCIPNKMATVAIGRIQSPGKRCSSNSTVSFTAFHWVRCRRMNKKKQMTGIQHVNISVLRITALLFGSEVKCQQWHSAPAA